MLTTNACGLEAQGLHADALALQVRDAADALVREQLEASRVHAGQERDRIAGIDRDQKRCHEVQTEIDFTGRNPLRIGRRRDLST